MPLQGSTTLGTFDKEKNKFKKRDKTTTTIFPYLDREALALMYDNLNDYFNNNRDNEFNEIQKIAKQHDFNILYSFVITKLNEQRNKSITNEIIGEWKKYNQDDTGAEARRLVNDIKNFGTGWCTAGYEIAKNQLSKGDFYVYFVNDENNIPKIPKIAIRLNDNNEIAEIRGTDANQNLCDERFAKIAEEKAKNFIGYEKYKKAIKDMAKLTVIYYKYYRYDKITHEYVKKEIVEELTKEDLRFLYEIDNNIQGFGYQKDQRILKLLNNRNIKKDLSFVLSCTEKEISLSEKEALSSKCIYHYGDLNLNNIVALNPNCLPKIVNGNLYLPILKTLESNCLPQIVNGNLNLSRLKTLEPNCLPQTISGNLDLSNLTTLEADCLPQTINEGLDLSNLTSLKPNCLPQTINGYLSLNNLTTLEPNCLPQTINGDLSLNRLTSLEPNCLPQTINGDLDLRNLTSLKPNCLPQTVKGDLDLSGLISLEPNCLPQIIRGDLVLSHLMTLKPNCLPQIVNGNLYLSDLTKLEPNCLPQTINGCLILGDLISLKPNCLPQIINGNLYLLSLTTLEINCLPQIVNGDLFLSGLTSLKPNCLPQTIDGILDLGNLTSLESGYFPKNFKFNMLNCNDRYISRKFIERVNESIIYWDNLEKEKSANNSR